MKPPGRGGRATRRGGSGDDRIDEALSIADTTRSRSAKGARGTGEGRRKPAAGSSSSRRGAAGRTRSGKPTRGGRPVRHLKPVAADKKRRRPGKTGRKTKVSVLTIGRAILTGLSRWLLGSGPGRRPANFANPRTRLRFSLVVVLVLFSLILVRLVYIQSADARAWAEQAENDRLTSVTLSAARGPITDRYGKVLADSVQARAVFADPMLVKDSAKTASALAGILNVSEAELLKKLNKKKRASGTKIRFTYLARGLDPAVGDAVTRLKLPGIDQVDEKRRDVPGHDLAANMIGFAGQDGKGLAGLESSYDDVLAGVDGKHTYEVSTSGAQIPDGFEHTLPAKPGTGISLTIDNDLQYQAQQTLAKRVRTAGGVFGSAVILDVKTGQVLANASYPTYDAAKPGDTDPKSWQDVASSTVVEPGSIHKAITMSAGLEAGVIKPDTVLTLPSTITKGGVTFRDTHAHGTVGMTLQGIMTQSSNVGAITVADKVGAQRLYDFQRRFGLGQKTHLGLPGESGGIVQPPANWSGPSYGGIPIGLGVATTPLQMVSAYQAIANDGVRIAPNLVKSTTDPAGNVKPVAAPASTRVMSAVNARAMRQIMEGVASKEGTAASAAIDGYRIAGKTGTGQQVVGSKYTKGNLTSFIGMAPAEAPRYVVGIFVKMPTKEEGGPIAGPAFHELMSFALRHGAVPPTGSVRPPLKTYG